MEFLGQAVAWLADPAHWHGRDGIPIRLVEHLQLSGVSVAIAAALALPAGVVAGHTGRGGFAVINLANVGRALPSIAILSLALVLTIRHVGLGFWPTVIALVFLAVPPIVSNTYVGIREVDRDLVEAARGLGMRERQIIWRAEIPLALPVILVGLRTASVQVIATATLGAIVASGGLGRYLIDGIATSDDARVFIGAFLVASLAVATELVYGALERALRYRERSSARKAAPAREPLQAARPGGI
ncbi:MAG: ABC transporter permease [Candidatus Limnocylindria bacterium]